MTGGRICGYPQWSSQACPTYPVLLDAVPAPQQQTRLFVLPAEQQRGHRSHASLATFVEFAGVGSGVVRRVFVFSPLADGGGFLAEQSLL